MDGQNFKNDSILVSVILAEKQKKVYVAVIYSLQEGW